MKIIGVSMLTNSDQQIEENSDSRKLIKEVVELQPRPAFPAWYRAEKPLVVVEFTKK
jgi:hypothetical protein